ncbi:MAG: DHA2 family efflux MFS transporter permease subunit [Candidatus Binataceae bacterium]|nr:DHA2 family efflux MFS transporter permease subunit [Candidatus Binataceae bacterium]
MAASPSTLTALPAAAPSAGKWLITASIMCGTVLSVMDVSIVNVAMPHMMGSFGQDLLTITWVSTAYSIAEMIMITMTAWWSALLGRKRLFVGSMILFTVGSAMAGTAQNFHQMLFWRVVQGAGGGSLIPSSQAILRETFPPTEQGMAMAIYAMGVMLAPAFGPVAGGWLVDHYGWRWIFYINIPICLVGILMTSAFVRDPVYLKRGLLRVDWAGIGLLTAGLTAMQIVLERGQDVDWFASNWIVLGTIVAVFGLGGLLVWEFYAEEPVVDFRLFRNLQLSVGSAMGALLGFVLYGSTFIIPQLTQDLLGYTAYAAGMVLMPRAATMFLLMPLMGAIYNHVNLRVNTFVGLAVLAIGQWQLCHLSLEAGYWTFLVPLLLLGGGLGSTMVPLSTISLSTVPRPRMTAAAGLYTLTRRVAGNLAYAVIATIVARRTQFHHSRLVHSVNGAAPIFRQAQAGIQARMFQFGYSRPDAHHSALALIGNSLNRHATMMAYNDANWVSMMMAIAVLPLILLLPKRAPMVAVGEGAH